MTKLSELKSASQIAVEEMRDAEVRTEIERTSAAEQLALLLITYRAEHQLSQTKLAELLGLHQSAVARLEAGDHEPSLSTLARLSAALDMHISLHIENGSVVIAA